MRLRRDTLILIYPSVLALETVLVNEYVKYFKVEFHIDINSQAPKRTSTLISLDHNHYFLQFALLTEKIMISSIIRNFHLHALRKTNDIPVIPEIITRPQGGITLVLKPRKAIDSSRISQIPIDKRGWKFWTVDNKFQNTNFRFRNYRLLIIIFWD